MAATRRLFPWIGLVLFAAGAGEPRPALATFPIGGPRAEDAAEAIPFPDGVIDPQRRTAFVTSAKGGIQAVRLEDGAVLWTNDTCMAQPWLVAGRRLIARGDRITVLDGADGKLLRKCEGPAYPKVAVPDRCTVAFVLWAPRVTGDTLEARWYAVAHIDRSKGRPFPFQAWTAFNKAAPAGTVKLNLDTGRATIATDAKPADVTAGLIPEAARPEQHVPAGLNAKLMPVWQQYHKDQNGRITLVGDRLVGVAMTLEKAGNGYLKQVTLNAWNNTTGAPAKPIQLIQDTALNIANIVLTNDRRHAGVVFSSSALAIYALSDGKRIGQPIKGVAAPEKAFVQGKRLYYAQVAGGRVGESPQTLKALDLDNGKVVWERALKPRSTIPLPP